MSAASLTQEGGDAFCSGAKISNCNLVIATIAISGNRLNLVRSKSAVFSLAGRDQRDLVELYKEAEAFFAQTGLKTLCIRGAPARGAYSGSGFGFKIEAALQLLSGVDVAVIPSNSTTTWLRREAPRLPKPDRRSLNAAQSKLQLEAIATAAHAWSSREVFIGLSRMPSGERIYQVLAEM